MASLLFLIAVILFFKWQANSVNKKVDNYPLWKVDSVKMVKDADKPKSEIRRNLIEGKYDYDPVGKMTPYQRERYETQKNLYFSAKAASKAAKKQIIIYGGMKVIILVPLLFFIKLSFKVCFRQYFYRNRLET
ncbi:MAG: hypothetical protein LUD77_08155 [Clostridiales bacterium]|nr:hypothetical protein [Clostridiales bacterium]